MPPLAQICALCALGISVHYDAAASQTLLRAYEFNVTVVELPAK